VGASSYPDHSTGPLCYNTFDMAPALFVTSKIMRPQVLVRYVDNVAILDLAGRFVDTLSISDTVKGLIDKGALNLLVNLEKAKLIGNGTTGELVSCWVTAKKSGGTLKVLNPDKDEKHWLEVGKLDTVLDIYYDEQSAVLSFR
jgi:anti-sigma B factor antagonist